MANENEARRSLRIALLTRSCKYDEKTAAKMVDDTQWLTDDEFVAHADYLSQRRSGMEQATEQGKKDAELPPQATSLPAPMAGHPPKVKTTDLGRVQKKVTDPTPSSTLASDVAAYIADVFNLNEDEEHGVAASTKAQQGKADDAHERTRSDIADYMAREVFGLEAAIALRPRHHE